MQPAIAEHSHVFLGEGHAHAERRTWIVIWLCASMMALEIVGGLLSGSIALVADGLHMSTHAGALLLAALAYGYARRHATDARFSFGTGKLGDLAGFSSAIVLTMIAALIGYEAISRLLASAPIHFSEAIPIACLGLAVNAASAWLLASGGHHHQGHHHGHGHGHGHEAPDEVHRVPTGAGALLLGVFEENHPPVFRLRAEGRPLPAATDLRIETLRPDGARQVFALEDRGAYLQSREAIPEPHAFVATLQTGGETHRVVFEEHAHEKHGHEKHAHEAHGATGRDNNMRAAIVHVLADAAVSLLVIVGLTLARVFGWLWMDPVAGIVGACVIASWSYGLIRATGAILLDMNPDRGVSEAVQQAIEREGDRLTDLHVWRLGPGHLGAIVSVATSAPRDAGFYREKLAPIPSLSHLTVEVSRAA